MFVYMREKRIEFNIFFFIIHVANFFFFFKISGLDEEFEKD